MKTFEAYLRGIETLYINGEQIGEVPFEAYLRGIETQESVMLCSCGVTSLKPT